MSARRHLSPHEFTIVPDSLSQTHYINAYHPAHKGGKEPVGHMNWNRTTGKINNIQVHQGYRRQGIASRMFEFSQSMDPPARHAPSNERTAAGKKWAKAVGGKSVYDK